MRRRMLVVLAAFTTLAAIAPSAAVRADDGKPTKERTEAVLSNLRNALRHEGEDMQVFAIQEHRIVSAGFQGITNLVGVERDGGYLLDQDRLLVLYFFF